MIIGVTFNIFWSSKGHKFLIMSLIIYSALLIMLFEGNLRASVIKRDPEKAIDTLKQLYDSGKVLYLPENTPQLQKLLISSLEYHRKLGRLAAEHNYFYNCFYWCPGEWQPKVIMDEGKYIIKSSTNEQILMVG